MDLGLRGRAALVLGGSQGIGRAVALELVQEGARVAIAARRREVLDECAAAIRAVEPEAELLAVAGDATDPDDLDRVAAATEDQLGRVDVLVNTVSFRSRGDALAVSDDIWRASFEGNLLPAARIARRLVPAMVDAGWGRVINVGAVSARQPTAGQSSTNVGKAALLAFTKGLATEVATTGVTVNSVLPGRIATETVLAVFSEEERAERASAIPMRRYGTPREMAAAVAFLASERASYLTGVALSVDGGLTSAVY